MNLLEQALAKKYAIAFLNIFSDLMKISDCSSMEQMVQFLRQNSTFFGMVQTSLIDDAKKEEMLKKILEHFSLGKELERLIDLLIIDQRLYLLPDILLTIANEYKNRFGFKDIVVSSAQPLSSDEQKIVDLFLSEQLHKQILPNYYTDPTLIAGVRLTSKTTLWEYSIKKQLQIIKTKFLRQELEK